MFLNIFSFRRSEPSQRETLGCGATSHLTQSGTADLLRSGPSPPTVFPNHASFLPLSGRRNAREPRSC